MTRQELASRIDSTLLRPDASEDDIRKLCAEAAGLKTASACVNPRFVPLAAELLRGSGVMVCTVAGFPLGASRPEVKALETELAVRDGADEIDTVLSVGALKDCDYNAVSADLKAVVSAAQGRVVKVILETCLLSDEEIIAACRICEGAGADFVKTSTGFSRAGASPCHVRLMKTYAGSMKVKAAGGIRTVAQALALLNAGADRLGCSAALSLCNQLLNDQSRL